MSKILEQARKYIGQAEDPNKKENTDFIDEEFEADIKAVGWQSGFAWCMLFVRLCVKKGDPILWEKVKQLITPSVMTTFNNLQAAGYSTSRVPVVGSIVIMQNGNKWQGHTGIVSKVHADGSFNIIEGNASASAKTRQGDQVAEKTWKNEQKPKEKGLWVRGFLNLYER